MSDRAKRILWVSLLLVVGVLSRWLPHAPNFTAILAVALFAGAVLPAPLALLVPIVAMMLGDLVLGVHDLMWVVYLSLLPMVWLGTQQPALAKRVQGWVSWAGLGLAASIFFFVVTNLAVFWTSGMYAHTSAGLAECFALALPFFHNTVLSTWVFLSAFSVVKALQAPAPAAQLLT